MCLTQFWQKLEVRRSQTAVLSEWHSVSGDSFDIIWPLLRVQEHKAVSFPNPRGGQSMKIVFHKDGTIVAVDENDVKHRIKLSNEDILLYRLDLNSLRKALCDAFRDIKIAKTPMDLESKHYYMGYWEPKKAASFPVYLLLCSTKKLLRQQIFDCQISCKREGAILLTPTRDKWDEDIEQLAMSKNMLLAALSEVIVVEGGSFAITDNWVEYMAAFCKLVKTTLPQNYKTPKPKPKRNSRMDVIEKLEKELDAHLIAARDHAYSLARRDKAPQLLPKPDQKRLAQKLSVSESAVSRALNDEQAKVLKILWNTADDISAVMKYKSRRQIFT